jgi:murein DD-endopeptidase MepM/ murein hydrolase activator NlpD
LSVASFLAALAVLMGLLLPSPALAGLEEDLARVDGRIEDLRSRVGAAREERSEIANAVLDLAEELDAAAARLIAAQGRLAEVDAEIDAAGEALEELDRRIVRREAEAAELQRRVAVSREAAVQRAVQLYMSGDAGSTALLVPDDALSAMVGAVYADDAEETARREVAELGMLRSEQQRAAARLEEERSALQAAAARLEDARARREVEEAEVAARAVDAEARLQEQEALLAEFDAEIAEIEGEITALASEQARIELLIAQEQDGSGSTPGLLARPVPGGVSSGFGYRVHPIYGDQRLHTGWDMNAVCGEPIRAAAQGRVFVADWKGGYGITVMIDHGGGMATLYAHQSRAAVGYGQQVSTGDVIGYAGTTGISTGCHLHFEVRLAGAPVDPAQYL